MYKGQLKGLQTEIVEKMLEYQLAQGNVIDISIFEKNKQEGYRKGGFDWDSTKENERFWNSVINWLSFGLFFEKYPTFKNQCQDFQTKLDLEILKTETSEKRNKLCDINILLLSLINDL